MPTLQEKRDKLGSLWHQNKALIELTSAEGRDLTPDEATAYDGRDADIDKLSNEIERLEKHANRGTAFDRVNRNGVVAPRDGDGWTDDDDVDYQAAFTAYLRSGTTEMNPEDRTKLRAKRVADLPKNALGVGTTTAGGYTVPAAFRDVLIETLKYYGPMISEAESLETESGVMLPWPTVDDTANVGAILAENTTISQQDLAFGQAQLNAYMYTSKLVLVSWQLLQDSAVDLNSFLPRKLGERLGRIYNQHWTTGTGSSQPTGIVTGGTVGITGTGSFATTTGIAYPNLVDMVESLDPAYGASGNLKWMMHQSVRKAIRKLVDAQNRPLWQPSLQDGIPQSLMDYPLLINNDMATLAVNSKSLLFGDIRQAYVTRQVRQIDTVRLDERFADALQVGFFGFGRMDGNVQNANAYRIFQTTATA